MQNLSFKSAVNITVTIFCCGLSALSLAQDTWTPTAALNSYAFTDNIDYDDINPEVAADGNGNLLSIWWSHTYPVNQLVAAHSADAGATWGTGVALPATSAYLQLAIIDAEIHYVGNNTWAFMWTTRGSEGTLVVGSVNVSLSTDMGQTWSTPRKIDTGGATSSDRPLKDRVDIAADGSGNVVATWLEAAGGLNPDSVTRSALVSNSTDYGQTWSVPRKVNVTDGKPLGIKGMHLSYAGSGKYVLSYDVREYPYGTSEFGQSTVYVATSNDLGETWTDMGPVVRDETRRKLPMVSDLSASGTQIVLASVSRYSHDPGLLIYATALEGTTFTAPLNLMPLPFGMEVAATVSIAHNSSGTWVLVADDVGAPDLVDQESINSSLPNIKAWRSTDIANSWTAEPVLAVQSTERSNPSVTANGNETFTSVYQSRNSHAPHLHRDFDIQSATSTDGGAPWAGTTFVNSNAASDSARVADYDVHIAGGGGTVLACWVADTLSLDTGEIMVSRSLDHGITWSPAVSLSGFRPRGTPFASSPQIHYTGDGSWSVFWRSELNYQVSLSIDNGGSWSPPSQVQMAQPGLVAGNHESRFLRKSGTETTFEASVNGGVTWQAAGYLTLNTTHIVHAGGSNWIAVGNTGAGGDSQDFLSVDDGVSWTRLSAANRPSAAGRIQQIKSDHNGTVVATYIRTLVQPGGVYTVETYAAVSRDSGATWSGNILVHKQSETTSDPIVAQTAVPEPVWIQGNRWAIIAPHSLSTRQVDNEWQPFRIKSSKMVTATSPDGGLSWRNQSVLEIPRFHAESLVPLFTSAGSGDHAVVAWDIRMAATIQDPDQDGDVVYRLVTQPRPPAAASDDWQLYQ